MFSEEGDAEDGAHHRFEVEEDSCLRGGNLSETPVPEEGGCRGTEDSAGCKCSPCAEGDTVYWRHAAMKWNPDGEHEKAAEQAVSSDAKRGVSLHELLVAQ